MAFPQFSSAPTLPMNPPPQPPMMMPPQPPLPNLPNVHFEAANQQLQQMQMMSQQNQNQVQHMMSQQNQSQMSGEQMQKLQHLQLQHIQQMQQMMHPAMNDAPLEFDTNKNKPPMPVEDMSSQLSDDSNSRGEDRRDRRDDRRGDRDRRDRRDRDDRKDRPTENLSSDKTGDSQVSNQMQMNMMGMNPMMGMQGMMGGMMGMMPMMGGMMGDPSMMSMAQYGAMMPGMMGADGSNMMGTDGSMNMVMDPSMASLLAGQKCVIECKECTLIPPSPNAPPPVTRERPAGCKTVFIGGIPDNCTEEIIRDVFGRCGEMQTVRLSKKNFCHIRFIYEQSVDCAIFLSGYRMRIGGKTDSPNTGRLHVDYAQARDDQYEFECRQRALQRELRHRERMERERMRPASPPPVAHYSDHEATLVSEKIKTDDGFPKSVQVVITWLERGDCSKRNSNSFYTMIQSTNSHVRRLLGEKMQFEEELQGAKDLHRTRVQGIVLQFGLIEKLFNCASHKKCWDHFTKAQRKNIESWKKQTLEIKQIQLADNLNEEAEEEMDVSDTEDDGGTTRKKLRYDRDTDFGGVKEENLSLRTQLEAYKNEVDILRSDLKADVAEKEKQVKLLQESLQNLQIELMDAKRRHIEDDIMMRSLQQRLKQVQDSKKTESVENGEVEKEEKETDEDKADPVMLNDREARFIGLISTFLHVHPFGASVDYIWSFLTKLDSNIRTNEVEVILTKYPTVFKQELSGIGASMERRWVFIGFKTNTPE